MGETVVLRFDSRTRRDERAREIARQINGVLTPELCADFHLLTDESTLSDGDEYVPFEQMYQDSRHMPVLTHAHVDAAKRYSERMRVIEGTPHSEAARQPRCSGVSEALQAIEREFALSGYN